jgi:dTDP-4-dehydrorhamnose reductase
LGLNIALEASTKHEVYGVVNSQPIQTDAFHVLQADLLAEGALEKVLEEAKPDWVIHCAALADVDACESQPDLAERINADLPGRFAREVLARGVRFLHISTDAVFDGVDGNYTEEDEPNPLSQYARTKVQGERAVLEANPEAVVARINTFGWSASRKRSLAEFFVNHLKEGQQVQGFVDVFFCPLLANDLVHVFLRMLENGLSGLYHAVGSECLTKYEFGLRLAEKFDLDKSLIRPVSIDDAGLKAQRAKNLTLRNDKLQDVLDIPLPTLSKGIDRFQELYEEGYPEKLRQMLLSNEVV